MSKTAVSRLVNTLLGRFQRTSEPEFNSGIPIEVTPHVERPLSFEEMVQRYVRTTLSDHAADEGDETFDEADDFDEEDPDVMDLTHHQVLAMSDDEVRDYASNYGINLPEAPQESTQPPAPGAPAAAPQAPLQPTAAVATSTPPSPSL